MRKPLSRISGFTLIELLTVVAIIGVLVSIGSYTYASSLARSRDNQRLTDLNLIKNALEQYYLENRTYPRFDRSDVASSGFLFVAAWQLTKMPNDPNDSYGCEHSTYPLIGDQRFLAPDYLAAIPEDPKYKFNFQKECQSVLNQIGQYLYISLPDEAELEPTRTRFPKLPTGYYLGARMERSSNQQSFSVEPVGPPLGPPENKYYDLGSAKGGALKFTTSSRTHNFLLKSK